ncbi:hypothetical protein [Mesorhizobium sp. M0296]|uniref:HVO_A0114 family putative DNA-binding protein n=1 Tax=Mesorhizobium sp. M0296 TaxID=2956931 RepID=UPI00333A7235
MTAFKHPAFAKLSPKIDRAAKELEQIEEYLAAHRSELSLGEWGAVAAVSLGAHNVYNGIEDTHDSDGGGDGSGGRASGGPEPMAQSCAPEEILRALTPENCRLVALIHRYRPQSITELCRLAARPQPNVSCSLAALERAGIVSMAGSRPKRPELAVQRVTIDLAELQNGRCEVDDSWRQIAGPSSLLRDGDRGKSRSVGCETAADQVWQGLDVKPHLRRVRRPGSIADACAVTASLL